MNNKRCSRKALAWFLGVNLAFAPVAMANSIANRPDSQQFTTLAQTSPFKPPKATDRTFVVDSGPGLDTGCTYRSGGPLRFEIVVTRHAADDTANSSKAPEDKYADLRMPAYDVDFAGAPGVPPERDIVRFNGHVVQEQYLSGVNGVWKLNNFKIPMNWIEFASDNGSPGLNHIQAKTPTFWPLGRMMRA